MSTEPNLKVAIVNWQYALLHESVRETRKVGVTSLSKDQIGKVRSWIKDWIQLCLDNDDLRDRMWYPLQAWSKFAKRAYAKVMDWPDKNISSLDEGIFRDPDYRFWLLDDMNWLREDILGDEKTLTEFKRHRRPVPEVLTMENDDISPSAFAKAITDVSASWKETFRR